MPRLTCTLLIVFATWLSAQRSPSTSTAQNTNLGRDANGNPLRLAARTKHVSNYDESKVGHYTLADPLTLSNGEKVRDGKTWFTRRRPEVIRLYESEIYGRIPAGTPKATWQESASDSSTHEGGATVKHITGKIGDVSDGPQIHVTLYTPAQLKGSVPIILLLNFRPDEPPAATEYRSNSSPDPAIPAEILHRGWGYATVPYQDIQPDRPDAFTQGMIGATAAVTHHPPASDEWGAISAWAWGVSRVIDYLETDKSVDAKRIALFGHSRLGKTVLWASALDERIAAVYSSCSGEMGAALARRDYGETIDDMAQNFPYQFATNFQKWVGHWNEMPVDAHMLIALSAPRPVFITGGTQDQWADPKGEFLAEVAAGPVYRLLGKKDLGKTELPPLDTPVISGDLGWYYHTGGHAATVADWKAFLGFLDKYFK